MKKKFYLLFSLTALLCISYWHLKSQLTQPFVLEEKKIYISPGTKLLDILQILAKEKISPSSWPLFLSIFLNPHQLSLKHGEYSFEKGMSPFNAMEKMSKGDVITYQLTIPEGFTSLEVVNRLEAIDELEGTITQVPEEGTLFPSSYDYKRGQSKALLIEKMKKTMSHTLKLLMEQYPGQNVQEKLIMASLIEKETALDHERSRIAGLFYNRLSKKIRLQCDPTVIYSLTLGKNLNRPLSKADLQIDSPFNTYRYRGLPPSPICNPGRASLESAFNPMQTTDLYFVTKEGKEHEFSQTLEAHNKAVKRLRERERKRQ